MPTGEIASATKAGDVLVYICKPPYFAARVELAKQLEAMFELYEARHGKVDGARVNLTSQIVTAKWSEHNCQANEAIVELAGEMIRAGMLNLENLKIKAREAMKAKKPVNLLNQQ